MIELVENDQCIGYVQMIIWNSMSVKRPTKMGYYIIEASGHLPTEVYLGSPIGIADIFTVSPNKTLEWPNGKNLSSSEIINILKRKDVFYKVFQEHVIIYENDWEPDFWVDGDEWVGPYCSTVKYGITAPIHTIE